MYAECPNCHAIFRVTPSILAQANGRVRCGECQTVFTAVVETQEPTDIDQDATTPELGTSPETEQIDLTAEEMAELFSSEVEEEVLEPRHPEPPVEETVYQEQSTEPQSELFGEKDLPQPQPRQQDPEYQASQAHSRETVRATPRTEHHSVFDNHTLLGILGLCLLMLLFGQYLYKNRDELVQYPSMRPMLETLCSVTGCELAARVSLGQIELLNHGIYSHPNETDALMIKATIVNHAQFKQPLPIIELSLSNIRGEKIALRRFGPSEYLPASEAVEDSLMDSEKQINISLQVKDPGKDALAFEFEFL